MLDFFQYHFIWVSNSLDPDQARHFVGPDLGPKCLQRLSVDNKVAPIEERVKYKTTSVVDSTFWLKHWLELISFGSNFFHLAKLATTNSERG